ncbi:hypothetical protein SASPL_127274 [Salvia splendens]|uniref:Pentatricopeptide repeat-containing protein n=1 Tax=Salvia splendens TaxID=180675 RepID=A0A8X8XJ10_SALSN|nr:hypothetical protein SASPL_127274 [Salvia splendens]
MVLYKRAGQLEKIPEILSEMKKNGCGLYRNLYQSHKHYITIMGSMVKLGELDEAKAGLPDISNAVLSDIMKREEIPTSLHKGYHVVPLNSLWFMDLVLVALPEISMQCNAMISDEVSQAIIISKELFSCSKESGPITFSISSALVSVSGLHGKLRLRSASEHNYLNPSECLQIPNIDNKQKFHNLMRVREGRVSSRVAHSSRVRPFNDELGGSGDRETRAAAAVRHRLHRDSSGERTAQPTTTVEKARQRCAIETEKMESSRSRRRLHGGQRLSRSGAAAAGLRQSQSEEETAVLDAAARVGGQQLAWQKTVAAAMPSFAGEKKRGRKESCCSNLEICSSKC